MRQAMHHRDQRGRLEVKMTPMIDVIFLLLIFFVCTASFQPPEETLPTRLSLPRKIDSPAAADPEVADLDKIVVKVGWHDRQGKWQPGWEINGQQYANLTRAEDLADIDNHGNVEDVLKAVKQIKVDLPVILDVRPAVPIEHVIDVYDLCRAVGLQKVQFAASVEQ